MRFSGAMTIADVRLDAPRERWFVAFEGVPEGASEPIRMSYSFPGDTLTWRAAEYGLDPLDVALLLDIVLHEPHMDSHGPDDPDFLYNTDTATARKALMARVSAVKARLTITDPHGHLVTMHAIHTTTKLGDAWHASLARKRAHVEAVRAGGSAAPGHSPVFANRRTDD